jgi:hypothetical protein
VLEHTPVVDVFAVEICAVDVCVLVHTPAVDVCVLDSQSDWSGVVAEMEVVSGPREVRLVCAKQRRANKTNRETPIYNKNGYSHQETVIHRTKRLFTERNAYSQNETVIHRTKR